MQCNFSWIVSSSTPAVLSCVPETISVLIIVCSCVFRSFIYCSAWLMQMKLENTGRVHYQGRQKPTDRCQMKSIIMLKLHMSIPINHSIGLKTTKQSVPLKTLNKMVLLLRDCSYTMKTPGREEHNWSTDFNSYSSLQFFKHRWLCIDFVNLQFCMCIKLHGS